MKSKENPKSKNTFKIRFLPFETSLEVTEETSILEAVKKANLPLKTTCGGKGTCGECVVQILSGSFLSKPSAALSDHLTSQGYALACLTKVKGNITLQLPQFQELSIKGVVDSKFFKDRKDRISGAYEIDPFVINIEIKLPSSTLEDNYSDLKRLERELQKKFASTFFIYEYSVLKKLAKAARKKHGHIHVTLLKSKKHLTILDVAPDSEKKKIYGIACDIGTTTVALHLVDLQNGKILSSSSSYNQQIKCGEDIISRINYAQKPGRLKELHMLIIGTINHLIEKVTDSTGISSTDIYYAAVSGNTTMTHLFLNLEPRYIREEPYVPTLNQAPLISSSDIGLNINQEGKTFCAPAVGSYVGGDITAGLLCTPMLKNSKRISLFIDAGTNGELVIGNKDWLVTCACSAGPAFEGSGIHCGIPASEGAIERIKIKKRGLLEYTVINNAKPKGLCGSALVDLLAELFIHGYIDRHGKFKARKTEQRIIETENGKGFLIEESKKTFWGKDLFITEKDISNLIRTKGAVFAAFSVLLKNVGLHFDQIESFFIAGGFGQHLNIENAIRIGLLPDLERKRFHYLGNSSLLGSYLTLLSSKNQEFVKKFSEKITYIELNTESKYMNEYTGCLFLPHTEINLFPSVKKLLPL